MLTHSVATEFAGRVRYRSWKFVTCLAFGACQAESTVGTVDAAISCDAGAAPLTKWHKLGDCPEVYMCATGGFCAAGDKSKGEPFCVAKSDAQCAESQMCAEDGFCFQSGWGCGPHTKGDCATTKACELWGHCKKVDGRCVPGSDADCKNAKITCGLIGACKYVGGDQDQCQAESQLACEQSPQCKESGWCQWQLGHCNIKSIADCKQSDRCIYGGECAFVQHNTGTYCMADPWTNCQANARCAERGDCGFTSYFPSNCVPRNDADCANSEWCKTKKLCKANPYWGKCVESLL